MMNHIKWLVDQVMDYEPMMEGLTVRDHPELSPREAIALRVKWGIDKGFVWFECDRFGDPQKAICMRPVNEDILFRISHDYADSLWDYDQYGKIVFIDFRVGTGSIPFAWDLCGWSGRKEVAYFHNRKLKRVDLGKVPRVKELLCGNQ